ncbi:Sensor histidine kinase RcsC [Emticicia aquatica]|uniref:Sensor histidine kinase RcsC n=1 Tax=Emticicia aquatica TaxID=1681835 RepID=A0ABN8EM11_9BACT|nr:response regulator [Emticicia aquatica]CAH0993899.1 Sensor histidine kinase RcsC [Emticicia aquatica]
MKPITLRPFEILPNESETLSKLNFAELLKETFELYNSNLKGSVDSLKLSQQTTFQSKYIEKLEYSFSAIEQYFTNVFMLKDFCKCEESNKERIFTLTDIINELQTDLRAELNYSQPLNVVFSLGTLSDKQFVGKAHLLRFAIKNALYYFIFSKSQKINSELFLKFSLISSVENTVRIGFCVTNNQFSTSQYFNDSFKNIDNFLDERKDSLSNIQESSLILIDILTNMMGQNSFISQSKEGNNFAINMVCDFQVLDTKKANITNLISNNKKDYHVKGNILIVDDLPMNQKFLSAIVTSMGFNSFFANNGQEAVEFSAYEKYDLIFMDFEMPILNGLDATTAIRSVNCINKNTPIILQSASVIEKIIKSPRMSGFTDVVEKPYKTFQVKDVISKYTKNLSEKLMQSVL